MAWHVQIATRQLPHRARRFLSCNSTRSQHLTLRATSLATLWRRVALALHVLKLPTARQVDLRALSAVGDSHVSRRPQAGSDRGVEARLVIPGVDFRCDIQNVCDRPA